MVWLIECQTLGTHELRISDDAIYEQYKVWQANGNEVNKSKASFLSWLRLSSFDIPGITKHRPVITLPGPQFSDMAVEKIQITEYIFNLKTLREHYKICNAEEVTEKEIEERAEMSDHSESDDDYEIGRRSFNDGEGPPSPHPSNAAVKQGYDDAKKASTTGEEQINKRARCV